MELYLVFSLAVYIRLTSFVGAEFCDCRKLADKYRFLDAKVAAVVTEGPLFSRDIRELKEKVAELNKLKDDITALKNQMDKLQKSIDTSGMVRDAGEVHDEELTQNITNMMTFMTEREVVLKNLSNEVAYFKEERRTIKSDLESEKRLRRSLENDIGGLKHELNETKSLKEIVDSLKKDIEDLALPTHNLSVYVDDLLSEREEIRHELTKETDMRIALEDKLHLLEMEVNETGALRINVNGLKDKLEQLEANVTSENLQEIIEIKFAHLSEVSNQTELKQRLNMLEYKFEVQQEAILGDTALNSSSNISLNNRVERLEKKVLTERNDTEDLIELIRDQIVVNNSIVDEISNSVKNVMNESKLLTTRVDDLQSDVSCINASLRTKQLDVEQILFTTESNHSSLNTDISLLKETLQELNRSVEEQITRFERQNATLRAILDKFVDFYVNRTVEINETFFEWKQKMNESTTELINNLSYETKAKIEEFMEEKRLEDIEVREKLKMLTVVILNLEDDSKMNFSLVDSKLKLINQEISKNNKQLAKIDKMEMAINRSASKEDMKHLTEQLVPISINISRLNGQMEDVRLRFLSLDTTITEVKNWAMHYIDNERKSLEKQLKNLEEKIQQDINNMVFSEISTARRELEAILDRHEQIISRLVNESQSESIRIQPEIGITCPHLTYIDPNVIATYEDKTYIPNQNSIMDGAELIFRCKHIGRYLLKGHSKIRCQEGKWTGNAPKCNKLPDEDDINASLFKLFKCPRLQGNYTYPLDCNKYYECKTNTQRLLSCPSKQKFDPKSESCANPAFSDCDDVPAIDFHPTIGLPDHPVGISPNGSLVVYPGVHLVLDCISRITEDINWRAKIGDVVKNFQSSYFGDKKTRMELHSVAEKDSGNYSCIKNMEKVHTIRLVVQAIECPTIKVEPPIIMSPSNGSTKMILSSRLHFSCEENYTINGASLLTCLATGKWSHDVPTCIPKGCARPNTTNDSWIQLKPDLQFYPSSTKVYLACLPDAPAKHIPSSIRCGEDGKWKSFSSTFPNCLGEY